MNTPVVSLQTPSLSGIYQSSYSSGHVGGGGGGNGGGGGSQVHSDFDLGMTSLHSVHSGWAGSSNSNSSSSSGGIVHHTAHLSNSIHLGYFVLLQLQSMLD